MVALILGWLSSHWLIVAAIVVAMAAIANPAAVWKAKAWILLAAVLWWGWTGHAAYDALRMSTDAAAATSAAQVSTARALASEAARIEEQTRARYVAGIDAAYQRGLNDAKRKGDDLATGLRAGSVRFKRLWQECAADAADPVPRAAADSGRADGVSQGRADSAGRVVRAVESDAAQIRCLQAIALTDRGVDPGELGQGCPVQVDGQHPSRPRN